MLAFNSIKYYSILSNQLERLEEYITFINENNPINEKQTILKKFLKSNVGTGNASTFSYIIDRNSTNAPESLIKSYMEKFKSFKVGFDFMSFYGLIREIEVVYKDTNIDYSYKDENYGNLIIHLNNLSKLYQNVFQSDDKDDIVLFFDEADKVCFEYYSVRNGLLNFIKSLENSIYIKMEEKNKVLELQLLDINIGLNEFGETLLLLESSYNAIKMLTKRSDIDNLKIVKIESGSLLAMLLGDENIIQLLNQIIKTVAVEMYQKFTTNGKLQKETKIMEMISSSADVIQKLDDMGINTGKSKSDIKDCLNTTTNNIYKIISKNGKIKLNDELLSIGNNDKLIEYKTLYLDSDKSHIDNEDVKND